MNVMYFASSLNIHRQLTTKYTESKKKQKLYSSLPAESHATDYIYTFLYIYV